MEYPIALWIECQVREQHELHPELTIKPRTKKQKEAIKKLVEWNKRRRAKKENLERERLEKTDGNVTEKRLTAEEEALERLRRRAKAKRGKKFKSDNACLDPYTE